MIGQVVMQGLQLRVNRAGVFAQKLAQALPQRTAGAPARAELSGFPASRADVPEGRVGAGAGPAERIGERSATDRPEVAAAGAAGPALSAGVAPRLPGEIGDLAGQPWCHACRQRRARCTGCGNLRPIRGGTLTDPLCGSCTRPDPSFWHICPGCGEPAQLRSRRCARCSLRQRLRELLREDTGTIHPQLQALHDNLANHERPNTVLAWLHKDTTTAILRELAAGERA